MFGGSLHLLSANFISAIRLDLIRFPNFTRNHLISTLKNILFSYSLEQNVSCTCNNLQRTITQNIYFEYLFNYALWLIKSIVWQKYYKKPKRMCWYDFFCLNNFAINYMNLKLWLTSIYGHYLKWNSLFMVCLSSLC